MFYSGPGDEEVNQKPDCALSKAKGSKTLLLF